MFEFDAEKFARDYIGDYMVYYEFDDGLDNLEDMKCVTDDVAVSDHIRILMSTWLMLNDNFRGIEPCMVDPTIPVTRATNLFLEIFDGLYYTDIAHYFKDRPLKQYLKEIGDSI